MTAASWPDHLLTLAEWDALPQDTSRCYELVEGVLLAVPRPAPLHQRAMWRLCSHGDIAGTVTIPSPVGITLNLDALITR